MNYPQQQYPPAYPQAPAQPMPPQMPQYPGFPQQGYAQPQVPQIPAQQPPAVPLAQGTLDDYFNQPSTGGGPSLSWTDKAGNPRAVGTTFIGVVARDVGQPDVQQETDFRTQQPKFYRDGRPKFVMKVPLKQVGVVVNGQPQGHPDYADGEAAWYVKGQARDELVRAMSEAGCSGAPKGGATIVVTLVQRKPTGQGMNPANVVQVRYLPAQGEQVQQQAAAPVAGAPSPAPEVPASQPQAPAQAPVQQYQQPAAPVQTATSIAQPLPELPQQAYAPGAQPIPQVAPVQVPQAPAPQPPADLSPEQQALLAQITGQQG